MNRKAFVTNIAPKNRLGLKFSDSGLGGPAQPRPFLGGLKTGFHAAPALGDQVLVQYEGELPGAYPVGTLSVTDKPEKLAALKAGESAIYHPDGRVLCFAKSDGSTTIFQDKNGHVVISVDNADNISLDAQTGTISIKSASSVSLDAQTGTISMKSPLVLTNQALTGSGAIAGTLVGTVFDSRGDSVPLAGGGCSIDFPNTLSLSINGTTHVIPLLS